jgi:hypothetical protein
MPAATTNGLAAQPPISTQLPPAQWGIAAGLADVITCVYTDPNVALPDGLLLCFRAAFTTLTTTPTFNPDNLGGLVITKQGGAALVAGDIKVNMEVMVRFNLPNSRWEWVNR